MATTTVKVLAEELKRSPADLLVQLKAAGIENFRFHDLRHTALTRLGNIETAFELAGHSDIRTTKRYFHTAEERVREAMIAAESRNSPEPDVDDRKKA